MTGFADLGEVMRHARAVAVHESTVLRDHARAELGDPPAPSSVRAFVVEMTCPHCGGPPRREGRAKVSPFDAVLRLVCEDCHAGLTLRPMLSNRGSAVLAEQVIVGVA